MKTRIATLGLLIATASVAGVPDTPEEIDPYDVITARENLMMDIEEHMEPIDTYTIDPSGDPGLLRENAETIEVMLQAIPHLFPANSNLYDPGADAPVTLALPAIWESFSTFYQLGANAVTAAENLSVTDNDPTLLKAGSLALRASCDACHASYLLPYEEPTVSEEDLDFDFDAFFEGIR